MGECVKLVFLCVRAGVFIWVRELGFPGVVRVVGGIYVVGVDLVRYYVAGRL